MVNAINAIDTHISERVPLPFLSCMVEDCVKEGKTVQEGGAHYNFTGPQGFGIMRIWQTDFGQLRLLYLMKRKSQWRNLKTHLSIITDKV